MMGKPPLTILLAGPRGFCAGVERAMALAKEAGADSAAVDDCHRADACA